MHRHLFNSASRLRGAWEGQAADAFFAGVESELLPALQRLAEALLFAEVVTRQIITTIREAEIEAAALFQGDAPAFAGKVLMSIPPGGNGDRNPYPYGTRAWAEYGLLLAAGIDPEGYNPDLGYAANREYIELGYAYYQRLVQENPEFYWMGFAYSAVDNSIYPAFLMLSYVELFLSLNGQFPFVLNHPTWISELPDWIPRSPDGVTQFLGPNAPPEIVAVAAAIDDGTLTAAHVNRVSLEFTRMQRDIFMDMGAAHFAYLEGGIELVREMGANEQLNDRLVRAFELIEVGDEASLIDAARIMAEREQRELIQDNYLTIEGMGDPGKLMLDAMSVMAVPPVVGGGSLQDVVPYGDIADIDQRMDWINAEIAIWAALSDGERRQAIDSPLPQNLPDASWALRDTFGPLALDKGRDMASDLALELLKRYTDAPPPFDLLVDIIRLYR